MGRPFLPFVLAAGLLVAATAWMAAGAAPPKLEGELAKLEFLIGTWNFTDRFVASGGEATGIYRAEAGPGGHSIVVNFHYADGPFAGMTGHEVFTWDAAEKVYKAYGFVSVAPGCFVRTGRWEDDKLVFSGELSTPGGMVTSRYVYVKSTPELVVIETSRGRPGAEMRLALRTTAKKQ
jgi:hypothetical protein